MPDAQWMHTLVTHERHFGYLSSFENSRYFVLELKHYRGSRRINVNFPRNHE
jgi:hypothetical protein